MKAIDFARARIAWTTLGGSRGLWRVSAAARREDGGEAWFLAAGVMAGDVYGQGRLPLDPPFSYQIAASHERHVIFREPLEASNVRDTVAPHAETFASFMIVVPEADAGEVPLDQLPAQRRWPLTARISAAGQSGAGWTLEFPVNHINLRDEPPAWQVETGPIVVPGDLIDVAGAAKPGGLQLAFVFFSRPDRADLLAFGPVAEGRRGFAHFARLEGVEIALFD